MKNQWLKEIKQVLINLGGQATLHDIYIGVQSRRVVDIDNYKDWKSQVRKNIYLHSSDCDIFTGTAGDKNDLFYPVKGKGEGVWALRKKF